MKANSEKRKNTSSKEVRQFPIPPGYSQFLEKPEEAIAMYVKIKDWTAALSIAEEFSPTALPDVLTKHAKACAAMQKYEEAEELYLKANRPDLAVEMYQVSVECLTCTRTYVQGG